MFRYKACRFRQEQEKMSAARLVLSREFGIMNSFTIEASLFAFIDRERRLVEFDSGLYETMGQRVGETVLEYQNIVEEDRSQRLQRLYLNRLKKKRQREKKLNKDKEEHKNEAKNKNSIREKTPSKPTRLSVLYENIRRDKSDYAGNSSDSDSNESQEDTLTAEEQDKALKRIIKVLHRYNSSECDQFKRSTTKLKRKLKLVTKNYFTIEASKGITTLFQKKPKALVREANKTPDRENPAAARQTSEATNLNHSISTLIRPTDTYKKKARRVAPVQLNDCYLPELTPVKKSKYKTFHKIRNDFHRLLRDAENKQAGGNKSSTHKSMNDIQLAVTGNNVKKGICVTSDCAEEKMSCKRSSHTSSRNYKIKYSVKLKNGIIIRESASQCREMEELARKRTSVFKYKGGMFVKDYSNWRSGVIGNSNLSKGTITQIHESF